MTEPHTLIDATGHELFVLGANHAVVLDIGDGDPMEFAEFADYDLASSLAESLRAEGLDADIRVDHDVIDLTAARQQWATPLYDLAVDDPGGWAA